MRYRPKPDGTKRQHSGRLGEYRYRGSQRRGDGICLTPCSKLCSVRPGNKIRIAICTEFGCYFFSLQQKNDTWLKLSAFSRSIQIGTIQSEKGGKQIKMRRNCNETFDCPDDGDGCMLASEAQEQG